MKTASTALADYLDAQIAARDRVILRAHCYTFTLLDGTVLRYTDAHFPVRYSSQTFLPPGPIVQGLVYRSKIGLDAEQQEITISAEADVLLNGAPFMRAIAQGVFDLARIKRERVYFADAKFQSVVGGLILFDGRILEVNECGRLSATLTVADDRVLLGNQMPRNSYSPTCNHALYGAGCGLDAETFATATTAGAGSTARTLKTSAAAIGHLGGFVRITSGALAGATATVKDVNVGVDVTLMFPLTSAPATGDGFKIYQGCDHTAATCKAKFSNLAKFRGFPFVPPPQYAQ
jgi:uncharacterized phage protein (TIGR02218 family)